MAHSFRGSEPEVFHQWQKEHGIHMAVSQDAQEAARTRHGCHLQMAYPQWSILFCQSSLSESQTTYKIMLYAGDLASKAEVLGAPSWQPSDLNWWFRFKEGGIWGQNGNPQSLNWSGPHLGPCSDLGQLHYTCSHIFVSLVRLWGITGQRLHHIHYFASHVLLFGALYLKDAHKYLCT